ncbi:SDR family NAD(P)-dependent oxidoreductase [Cryptosporangium sp. NPDC051539]|uniref:SDR family NAD(P)-dependent oxidoreductase n=1 Tax=Cryptosporangium sp. NPDC051539 TaxID=3363962 RepID=UPI0037A1CFB1
MFDLTGSVALVTGGNSGIGLGLASGLVRAGASVCIWGTNPAKNAAALDALTAEAADDGRVAADVIDVSHEASVEQGVAALVDRFGRLDSCFANAAVTGRFGRPRFVDSTLADWRAEMAVNLDGAYLTLRAAARQMVAQGEGGSLVGTASLAVRFGAPHEAGYAAAKAGVVALMQSLAVELGRHGIRANTLVPGWTRSPQFDAWLEKPGVGERILARLPLRRWGTEADWSGIAVYLASKQSAFHTGDTFRLDGGYGVF